MEWVRELTLLSPSQDFKDPWVSAAPLPDFRGRKGGGPRRVGRGGAGRGWGSAARAGVLRAPISPPGAPVPSRSEGTAEDRGTRHWGGPPRLRGPSEGGVGEGCGETRSRRDEDSGPRLVVGDPPAGSRRDATPKAESRGSTVGVWTGPCTGAVRTVRACDGRGARAEGAEGGRGRGAVGPNAALARDPRTVGGR